jgi:hypothetical protein
VENAYKDFKTKIKTTAKIFPHINFSSGFYARLITDRKNLKYLKTAAKTSFT